MDKLKNIRQFPKSTNKKYDILFTISVIILGLLLGFIAKATDSISVIGDIGTDLGVWIFIVSMIASFSSRPLFAIINTPAFLISMLLSYYVYGQVFLGFFPKSYFIGWLIIALLSPSGGIAVWLSHGSGIIANICAAIPASILFACGYPAYYTHNPIHILNLLFAVLLLIILPKTWKERAIATGIALIFAMIIVQLQLISYLPR